MERVRVISSLIGPRSVLCDGFMDEEGNKHRVLAVIAPITMEIEHEGEADIVKVSWGCNRGCACANPTCRYSKRYQELLKWAKSG